VTAWSSRAFVNQPVSWPSRTGASAGMTSPEELLAAAHASCYSMALAGSLGKHGLLARRLDVTAVVALEQLDGKWTITKSTLEVHGDVPGVDEAAFQAIAERAAEECPMSRALHNNLEIEVRADLAAEELAAAAGP
jgi:osmotically inducible protein OsmC